MTPQTFRKSPDGSWIESGEIISRRVQIAWEREGSWTPPTGNYLRTAIERIIREAIESSRTGSTTAYRLSEAADAPAMSEETKEKLREYTRKKREAINSDD